MKDISRVRYEALAAYCRHPQALAVTEEIRCLAAHDEAILVLIVRDRIDGDYAAMLLARDLKERYRWVAMTKFFVKVEEALAEAPTLVQKTFAKLSEERAQGDETGKPIDFFTSLVEKEKLNPHFIKVIESEGYSPAVELMKPMMRWYEDADGNFIEQFQTTGFDTRLWELYLFATLIEAGFAFDKTHPMPDFCARDIMGYLCIEATTINPSRAKTGELIPPPDVNSEQEMKEFQTQYMPIRYAGPLTTKLAKKYWEKAHVSGHPFAIAVQDFHAPGSMLMSRTALPIYLYGMIWGWIKGNDGTLVITPRKVDNHVWGSKVVQSGFFSLPDSENISAVIANPSATISKFNRMGVVAGFGSERVRMIREGTAANPDPNSEYPTVFRLDVNSDEYTETWIEGMDVYHNPNARYPLNPEMLPGAAHHWLREDGQLKSLVPDWQPMASVTHIFIEK